MSECRHNLGMGIMCIRCTNEAAAREREERLKKRVAELEAAIRKHHQNVWGDSNVKHPEDVELYATLEGEK